jgi:hypothetical protein
VPTFYTIVDNSNLLYEFYKAPFCGTRFLEHEERSEECYKVNKCDKIAYKTSVIQYFFLFCPYFKFKKVQSTNKELVTLVTRRTIAGFEFKVL